MSTGTDSSKAMAAARGGEGPEQAARVRALPALAGVRRVLFLGDSITYGGLYVEYLGAYLATRFPEQRVELINLGLPSETASGLSEPGHAGGAFPRPGVHERLQRALEKVKPDLVLACYGMNDGIYYPLSEERFRKFRDGMGTLVRQVRAFGARVIVLTPPVFDSMPLRGKTLPAGRDSYPGGSPYVGYDEVLTCYSRWLVEQHRVGWPVFDVHGPMARHLAARRQTTAGYALAGDGVHANPFGHWLVAQAILTGWRAPSEVDAAVMDLKAMKAIRGEASEPGVEAGAIRFAWQTQRPMPMDPRWDRESVAVERVVEHFNRWRLIVRNAPAPRYRLFSRDVPLDTFSRDQLAAGVDLLRYPDLDANQGASDLLGLIHQRQCVLRDAWLSEVGHQRPGVARGLPVSEAAAKAEELSARIRELAAPVTLTLRLEPVATGSPDALRE